VLLRAPAMMALHENGKAKFGYRLRCGMAGRKLSGGTGDRQRVLQPACEADDSSAPKPSDDVIVKRASCATTEFSLFRRLLS
jgi:hypothetical protein